MVVACIHTYVRTCSKLLLMYREAPTHTNDERGALYGRLLLLLLLLLLLYLLLYMLYLLLVMLLLLLLLLL